MKKLWYRLDNRKKLIGIIGIVGVIGLSLAVWFTVKHSNKEIPNIEVEEPDNSVDEKEVLENNSLNKNNEISNEMEDIESNNKSEIEQEEIIIIDPLEVESDLYTEYRKEEEEKIDNTETKNLNPYYESYTPQGKIEDKKEITDNNKNNNDEEEISSQINEFNIQFKGKSVTAVINSIKINDNKDIIKIYNKNNNIQYLEYCEPGYINIVIDLDFEVKGEYALEELEPIVSLMIDTFKELKASEFIRVVNMYNHDNTLSNKRYTILAKIKEEVQEIDLILGYNTEKEYTHKLNLK